MSTVNWILNNNIYEVSSLNHLLSIVNQGIGFTNIGSVPIYWSAKYIQTVNIDCDGIIMKPIGINFTFPFIGSYNGNNFEIKNWQNDQNSVSNYQGLFGFMNKTGTIIENIKMTGVIKVKGGIYCGVICGNVSGQIDISNITIEFAINSIITGTSNVGGLCGVYNNGNSNNKASNINLSGSVNISGTTCVGGVIGYIQFGTTLGIINSINGNITGTSNVGGIIGFFEYGSLGTCAGLINIMKGNITGSSVYIGGIVGSAGTGTLSLAISSCLNKMLGNITGSQYVGGIVGKTLTTVTDCINVMKGNIISTDDTYSGGIGYNSSFKYTRNIVVVNGNIPHILMKDTSIISATNLFNNIFSNRFMMTVNNQVVLSNTYVNIVTLEAFPTIELTLNGTIKYINSSDHIPYWIYSYTDNKGILRTVTSDISMVSSNKQTMFEFSWIESIESMTNIGIGNNNPSKALDITGDINISGGFYNNSNNETFMWNINSNLDTYFNLSNGNIGLGLSNPQYLLDVNGDIKSTTFIDFSDIRLKENIYNDTLGIEFINNLHPKTFKYINDTTNKTKHGLIAQDLIELGKSNLIDIDGNGYYSIQMTSLLGPIVNSIKDLSNKNKILKEKINLMKNNKSV